MADVLVISMTVQCDCSSIKTSKPFLLEFITFSSILGQNHNQRLHYRKVTSSAYFYEHDVFCMKQLPGRIDWIWRLFIYCLGCMVVNEETMVGAQTVKIPWWPRLSDAVSNVYFILSPSS